MLNSYPLIFFCFNIWWSSMVHPPHRVCIWVSVSWAWRQKCLGMLFHTSPSSDAQLLSVMWEKQPDSPSFFLHQCKSSKLKRHLFNKTNLGRESRFQGCSDWMYFLSLNSLPQGSQSTQDIVISQRRTHLCWCWAKASPLRIFTEVVNYYFCILPLLLSYAFVHI